MGVETGHDYSLDSEFSKENVEVCLEESAISALRDDKVFFRNFQLRNDLSTLGADDCVVSPDGELAVNAPVTKSFSISTTRIAGLFSFAIMEFFCF